MKDTQNNFIDKARELGFSEALEMLEISHNHGDTVEYIIRLLRARLADLKLKSLAGETKEAL